MMTITDILLHECIILEHYFGILEYQDAPWNITWVCEVLRRIPWGYLRYEGQKYKIGNLEKRMSVD